MLLKGITEVQGSNRPVSAAEMVLIRLAHAADLPTLDEALAGVEPDLPACSRPAATNGAEARSAESNAAPASAVSQSRLSSQGVSGGAQTMRLVEAPAPSEQSPEPRADEKPQVPIASLEDIASLADANRDLQFKVLLKRCVRPVRIQNGRIEVSLTEDAPRALLNDMSARLKDWTGRNWIVSLSREEGGPTLAEIEEERRETAITDARADPAVAAILSHFPGAKIIDVRIPDGADAELELDETGIEAPDEDDDD
jgi:DNA polymerase-3 subunit gamma/tau